MKGEGGEVWGEGRGKRGVGEKGEGGRSAEWVSETWGARCGRRDEGAG